MLATHKVLWTSCLPPVEALEKGTSQFWEENLKPIALVVTSS
jgi:hypothetical protein